MSLKTYDASSSAFVERNKVKIYKDGAWSTIESAKAYKDGAWEEMFYSGTPLEYENSYGTGFTITPYEISFVNDTFKYYSLSVTFSGWIKPRISFDWYFSGSGTISGLIGVSPSLRGYYNGSEVFSITNLFGRYENVSGQQTISRDEQVSKLVFTFNAGGKSYSDLEQVVFGIKNLVINGEKYILRR